MAEDNQKGAVKITSGTGEVISLNTTNVVISFRTMNQDVLSKGTSMALTVTIFGKITDTNVPEIIKIFNWSKSFNREGLYRTLEIVSTPREKVDRKYKIPEMFVVNYKENLGKETGSSDPQGVEFELVLRQKEECFDQIKTY